jgi:hypothetical protein
MKPVIPVIILFLLFPGLLAAQERTVPELERADSTAAGRMLLRAALFEGAGSRPPLHLDLPAIDDAQKKSSLLAVLYSVLLPGMGEWYAGRTDRMVYPLVSEGLLWMGFAGFNVYAGAVRDDARVFARQHARVASDGLGDDFYVAIGNYNSIDEYNDAKLVQRDLAALYTGDLYERCYWKWDAVASRLDYKDQRLLSDNMYNAGRFVVAGLIINRIWSAVESAFFVRRHNEALATPPTIRSQLLMRNNSVDGLALRLTTNIW